MKLNELKEVSSNVNLDEYLELYNYVRDNMEHPEWLGTFTKDEIIEILGIGGKIWMYYDGDIPVCSVFYIPTSNKSLRKHNVEYDEKDTGSLGPIMVSKEYVGNGLQSSMLEVLDKYVESIGKTHMFTKAHSDNIYSIRNILKNGYKVVDKYENERGRMTAFAK
ncbi:MAG: GNAT family N-acetyltransferase [Bacilli bacterium]|nr:GNAT family N-acetyltransferase [Bacilli bacterium]